VTGNGAWESFQGGNHILGSREDGPSPPEGKKKKNGGRRRNLIKDKGDVERDWERAVYLLAAGVGGGVLYRPWPCGFERV